MRICPIASGSSGNCIYVGSDTTHLLVDVGISGKKTNEGLNGLELSMEDINGILITHEHSDHIKGLGVLARKYGKNIYCTEGTKKAILKAKEIGQVDEALFVTVNSDNKLNIGDICVNPLHVSHDAADPVAYRFKCGNSKAAIVTDLGTYDEYTIQSLQGIDVLLLEANHDINMLQVGPYPYPLKQRILSDRGHLSNENAGRLLSSVLHDNMKEIILGHLSQENNYPNLAYEAVRMEVTVSDSPYNGGDFPIQVANRNELSRCVFF